MAAPYRSGDGQGQADGQTCKPAGRQMAKRSACHPGKHADARSGKRAALPTGGRSCSQRYARPSPGWVKVCRISTARQTRSGSLAHSRERRSRISRWHGRPRGITPLSGPVPPRAAVTAGRNPTAKVGLGRFGRGTLSSRCAASGRGRRRRGPCPRIDRTQISEAPQAMESLPKCALRGADFPSASLEHIGQKAGLK